MSLTNIKDKHFSQRKKLTDSTTYALTQLLEKYGHWKIQRYTSSEEDQEELVDLFVEYPNKKGVHPVQFKVRTDPKYRDFIVARYQPCYGLDQEVVDSPYLGKTCNGRDWRGLVGKKSSYYYVATMSETDVFDEISYCVSSKLRKRVVELDNVWETRETKNKFAFTGEAIDNMIGRGKRNEKIFTHDNRQDEVWYQKNYTERPKFLMYIDTEIRDGYLKITSKMQTDIANFKKEFEEQC